LTYDPFPTYLLSLALLACRRRLFNCYQDKNRADD
jgi:hypothetical protein